MFPFDAEKNRYETELWAIVMEVPMTAFHMEHSESMIIFFDSDNKARHDIPGRWGWVQ